MNKSFDIIVAKEFQTTVNGKVENRKVWNRVGRAWHSKSGESMSFELYQFVNLFEPVTIKNFDFDFCGKIT
ncbi:MAG: hypothetical protein KDD38_11080 [Bdellovibrionales bacterium]|nr:hypothetical protein [Bdellovibrionales bacterium]